MHACRSTLEDPTGIYDFDPSRGAIYVRSVRDEDLVRLKRDHPADSARLAAAGMETMTLLSYRMERDLFFHFGKVAVDWPTLIANATGNAGYMWTCSDPVFDSFTDESNRHDGGLVKRRDALGLDCTAWAWDLVRRDEPYEARGEHPSGVGIDRYRKFSDLSREEQKLLRRVRWFALLPLADPFLFLNNGWGTLDRRFATNASFFMTSFGWTVDHNVFARYDDNQLLFVVHHNVNDSGWLPGLDAQLWRWPVESPGGRMWYVTIGAGVWLQPAEQRWDTDRAEAGTRFEGSLAIPVWRRLELDIAAGYKTAGWVAGVAALGPQTHTRVGLNWRH